MKKWTLILFVTTIVLFIIVLLFCFRAKEYYKKNEPTFETLFYTLENGSLKPYHFLKIYTCLFERFKSITHRKIVILEIGIRGGGGIEMFYKYFYPNTCEIHGIDIDGRVKRIHETYPQCHLHYGDQADPHFLKRVVQKIGQPIDIVLDDGGHFMHQQIISFETLFPHVSDGGIYVIEDTHTSYDKNFSNGSTPTLIDYMKQKIDSCHETHESEMMSIQFFDGIVAVHKKKSEPFRFVYRDKKKGFQSGFELKDAPDPFS
jgi:hypothetical protein